MKRLLRLSLVLILLISLTNVANAAPKPGSNLKSVAHVAAFPFKHPAATIEGFIYTGLKIVGSAVDVAERGAAAVHAGVSKVDEAVDKIEDVIVKEPAPPAPAPQVP